MGTPIDREGTFRGQITDYALQASGQDDSQALQLRFKCSLDELYNGSEWEDWRVYQFEAWGSVNLVKRDGSVNTVAAERFIQSTGWDGDIDALNAMTWQPRPCQFSVKQDEYNGQVRFVVAFIDPWDRQPGGLKPMDDQEVHAVKARYGSAFRAIVSKLQGSQSAQPAAQPAVAPPPANRPGPAPVPTPQPAHASSLPEDGVPF